MASFKKTNVKIYTKPGVKTTPDTIYWKKLGVPVLLKEFGPVDFIDFSPVEPHYFAVTCSVKVQVYNAITRQVYKNLSRFRETAYGGSFRSDGRLLCAGGEEAHVKLFDVSSKSLLRVFKGHKSAVHRCFFTADKTHIASFSDDKSVCLWDIPSEKEVISFSEHTDYVRAGTVSPVSADIILSGGYDNIVRMYDTRAKTAVFQVDHGAPVESTLFLPSGGVFLSAGGTEIRVWDALAGGKLLAKVSQHHKTITCLKLCSENKRLLSSSLDRHVKIYDISTYQVVHTLDYPNAVLSFGVSAKDETVVAGMVDGLISISRREDEIQPSRQERRKVSYRYAPDNYQPASVDVVVPEKKLVQMSNHDVHLRKFQYSKALDCVLKPYVVNKTPHVTVSVLLELMRRKALRSAIAGREGRSLLTILRFLIKYIGDYKFTRILIDVTNIFMDVYEDVIDQDPEVSKMCSVLAEKLRKEEELTKQLLEVQGALQLILSAASVGEQNIETRFTTEKLYPSENAQVNPVVNVKIE
ncbi:U3 small nucleolar RNA-associated protein 15 homolog [Schistocerca americana]|uniref:U3 small nucleolar RNA-associated protein 15 homolog n=1 Tax=Schistocerca americana TaxID=7009 RepID=UPI001F4FDAEA|nr:U3 small nucleolar RNA-associated protein 15 homolog [Schistocerca americana]XP_049938466.1 U3 small nucleolar RNA-associated protein 15 homolog [Schistocerca serialis cubense]